MPGTYVALILCWWYAISAILFVFGQGELASKGWMLDRLRVDSISHCLTTPEVVLW